MTGVCDCCGERGDVTAYDTANAKATLCAVCHDDLQSIAVEDGGLGPDDDDYIDRPALGRTHPYGTRAL